MKLPFRRIPSAQPRKEHAPAVTPRRDTHITHDQSPVGIGIDAQIPWTMPRGEDDALTRRADRDVHDQPGSGGDVANRQLHF